MSKAIHKVSDDQLEQLLISVYCINRKRRTDPLFTVRKYQQKHVRLAFRAAVWSGSDCDHPQRRTTNPFRQAGGVSDAERLLVAIRPIEGYEASMRPRAAY
jgi:hypothetical protein